MIRRIVGVTALAAGAIWSILFPKKASWDFDMVTSVFIGLALLASGALILASNRMRPATVVLSLALTWSIAVNAYLLSWSRQANEVLTQLARHSASDSRK